MKIVILAMLRAWLRPIAAKLFPEQFQERPDTPPRTNDQKSTVLVVDTLTPPEFKQHVLDKLRRTYSFDNLDEESTEADIRHTIGYNQCIKHIDRLWEIH